MRMITDSSRNGIRQGFHGGGQNHTQSRRAHDDFRKTEITRFKIDPTQLRHYRDGISR